MNNPMELTDRVTMVTRDSSGIGRATSVLRSQLGARVILVGRNQARLSETFGLLDGTQHSIEAFDLNDPEDLLAWMDSLAQRNGMISGLAHCAGAQLICPLKKLKTHHIEEILRINLVSSLMLAKSFRQKGVNAGGGSVAFVSSTLGKVGALLTSAYCASKSALHSLTKALALELARDNIRVNCVAPGFVQTEMLEEVQSLVGEKRIDEQLKRYPLGFCDPRDVACALTFLLADTGRWITGSILTLDGGFTPQ